MKALVCWLLGHEWDTTYNPERARQYMAEIEAGLSFARLRVPCKRCGSEMHRGR